MVGTGQPFSSEPSRQSVSPSQNHESRMHWPSAQAFCHTGQAAAVGLAVNDGAKGQKQKNILFTRTFLNF